MVVLVPTAQRSKYRGLSSSLKKVHAFVVVVVRKLIKAQKSKKIDGLQQGSIAQNQGRRKKE